MEANGAGGSGADALAVATDPAAGDAAKAALSSPPAPQGAPAPAASATPGATASPSTGGAAPSEAKKSGRPVHPLWAHFHRGEKRNRYHYHAFCVYCVARYGSALVSPTRGVSTDMLRHLESCTNCPRKVVEQVKAVCERREQRGTERAASHRKKAAVGDGGATLLPPVDAQTTGIDALGDSNDEDQPHDEPFQDDQTDRLNMFSTDQSQAMGRADKAVAAFEPPSPLTAKRVGGDGRSLSESFVPSKRPRRASGDGANGKHQVDADRAAFATAVLRAVVASNLPLGVLQQPDFQALLASIGPFSAEMFDDHRVLEAARQLAAQQLDRVKEGMLNSTIKGGLTLSVNCWTTRDLQHLVAFALLNSNGDAACVRVVDMGNHVNAYTSPKLALVMEDVLLQLQAQSISVLGVVADSVVALVAARRVCRDPKWASLLVVPCISAVLTTLAGSIFTHPAFCDAVGQLIEMAAFFSNPALLAGLRMASGDPDARIPLPHRDDWHSLVECLAATLELADVITSMCVDGAADVPVPRALVELVVGQEGAVWKTLRDLERVLAPLREAHSVVMQPPVKVSVSDGRDAATIDAAGAVQSGLTLAHVMHQLGRMSQQYAALQLEASSGSTTESLAQLLQSLVDAMWRRYDLPAMALAYMFDFHLDGSALNLSDSALEWKAVEAYFARYYQRWFGQDIGTQAPQTVQRVADSLCAFQLRQFPFDAATTGDYTDVSSFYSFVSDSHPDICALCCRLYALGLASANVRRVVTGIGFVPPAAQTTDGPATVELLLHVGFAASLKKRIPAAVDQTTSLVHGVQFGRGEDLLCGADEWSSLAIEWRRFLDHELAMDEFEQLNQMAAGGAEAGRDDQQPPHVKLALEQTFVGKLPPLPTASFVAETQDGSHPASVLL